MAVRLSMFAKQENVALSLRQLEMVQKWLDDDWEAADMPRDLVKLVRRLLITIQKGKRA